MKAVNAYHRKHGTLDGCPDITPEQSKTIAAGMERDWRSDPNPFEAYRLTNNAVKQRYLDKTYTQFNVRLRNEDAAEILEFIGSKGWSKADFIKAAYERLKETK